MRFFMARRFALKNLRANRLLEIPFVLSSGIMGMLFFIMASLLENHYVETRHRDLPLFIQVGTILLCIFTFIFIQYAVNFMLKKRNKEFALYGILGLEKKHIRKIIAIEFFCLFAFILVLSIVGGYLFGQMVFLMLNFIMRDVAGRLMDFPFSFTALLYTTVLLFVLYLFTLLRSSFRISFSTPMALLQKGHEGEGEPKSRVILSFIGFLFLGIGYGIALLIQGLLSSFTYFFLAVLAVILATYLLYISFSVLLLKMEKRRPSYYKPEKFLSISGLLYRIKGNAVSLASISILSTGVILSLATTICMYANIQNKGNSLFSREYSMELSPFSYPKKEGEDLKRSLNQMVLESVNKPSEVEGLYTMVTLATAGYVEEGQILPVQGQENMANAKDPNMIILYDLAGYNARFQKHITLGENKILLCNNRNMLKNPSSLKIGDRVFQVSEIQNLLPVDMVALGSYGIVVRDLATMEYIEKYLQTEEHSGDSTAIEFSTHWNLKGITKEAYQPEYTALKKELKAFTEKNFKGNYRYSVENKDEYLQSQYELNGGFLFLGVLIGIIFLTGTVLISYYKQISEGYEDREKMQIMKKLGLSDRLIQKTGAAQILWLFFGPLAVATLHCLVASKIIFRLLGLFGVGSLTLYAGCLSVVLLVFALVYLVIFQLTKRAYTRIVE